jgi:thiamine biosynthesis protein ThiS
MRLKVNGQEVQLEAGMHLDNLLTFYKLKKDMVVVEHNRAVPPKEAYARTFLQDGDQIEIVKFLGGG